ncbi:MAG: endonuclease III [Candidatus Micrarchaeia archaeon]
MRETVLQRKARALKIISLLKKAYPRAKCSLAHENPLQLLVATILSAQCTDARVNIVTPKLFAKYRTARDFASADIRELESLVRSTGFYRNKAKNIREACRIIAEKHGGGVPRTMQEMLELPGVARKTANIVLGNSYGVVEGVPVDTHAIRISRLLGWTKNSAQGKIERDLMAIVPKEDWLEISNLFVFHGRAVCIARRPKCSQCPVEKYCPKAGLEPSRKRR